MTHDGSVRVSGELSGRVKLEESGMTPEYVAEALAKQKALQVAKELEERADAYQQACRKDDESTNWAVVTALFEVASAIRRVHK
jgi:hypothetical protein